MNNQSFHLIQPNQLSFDSYFKVYVTPEGLYFAKIGGQLHSDEAYDSLPLVAGLALYLPYKQMQKKQQQREEAYDQLATTNRFSEILANSRNSLIRKEELKQVTVSEKKSFHTMYSGSGSITLSLTNGKKQKFLVPSHESLTAIQGALASNLEVAVEKN